MESLYMTKDTEDNYPEVIKQINALIPEGQKLNRICHKIASASGLEKKPNPTAIYRNLTLQRVPNLKITRVFETLYKSGEIERIIEEARNENVATPQEVAIFRACVAEYIKLKRAAAVNVSEWGALDFLVKDLAKGGIEVSRNYMVVHYRGYGKKKLTKSFYNYIISGLKSVVTKLEAEKLGKKKGN